MVAIARAWVSPTVTGMTNTTTTSTTGPNDPTSRWQSWHDTGLPTNLGQRLHAVGTYSDAAIKKVEVLAEELDNTLERFSPTGAIDRFLAAPTEWEERIDRWATLGVLERLSQIPGSRPARPAWSSPTVLRRRPLSEVEIGLVRHSALGSIAATSSVGSLDAGLVSGELAKLTSSLVAFDGSAQASGIRAPGTQRESSYGYPMAGARVLEVPPWARASLTRLCAETDPEAPLLYGGRSRDAGKIQSSILMVVRKVLIRAGLGNDESVTPLSIRNTSARRVYDAHGLEAAAHFLGHHDLMSVAREIGIREHLPARRR